MSDSGNQGPGQPLSPEEIRALLASPGADPQTVIAEIGRLNDRQLLLEVLGSSNEAYAQAACQNRAVARDRDLTAWVMATGNPALQRALSKNPAIQPETREEIVRQLGGDEAAPRQPENVVSLGDRRRQGEPPQPGPQDDGPPPGMDDNVPPPHGPEDDVPGPGLEADVPPPGMDDEPPADLYAEDIGLERAQPGEDLLEEGQAEDQGPHPNAPPDNSSVLDDFDIGEDEASPPPAYGELPGEDGQQAPGEHHAPPRPLSNGEAAAASMLAAVGQLAGSIRARREKKPEAPAIDPAQAANYFNHARSALLTQIDASLTATGGTYIEDLQSRLQDWHENGLFMHASPEKQDEAIHRYVGLALDDMQASEQWQRLQVQLEDLATCFGGATDTQAELDKVVQKWHTEFLDKGKDMVLQMATGKDEQLNKEALEEVGRKMMERISEVLGRAMPGRQQAAALAPA